MKKSIVVILLISFSIISLIGQKNVNIKLEAAVPQGNIQSNDVWGYTDTDGTEYAIFGTREQTIIYDISIPSDPVEITTIPGTSSIWRDFKSYKSFVYQTTDQGSDGLTIIDMTLAPDSIGAKTWTPEIEINGVTETLRTCHNIWIDTLSGRAFLAGCNVGSGGALILDIATDPLNPNVVGFENERYAHDLITRDTLLFASEINDGNLGIYSIADIENPVLLSRTQTTSSFTHNAWFSDDGNFIYTTDERGNSFVDAYNITDLSNPIRIDTYQPVEGAGVIPHNVHVKDDFIIASWYGEGVIILDASRPHNLLRVGQYDTDPAGLGGSTGCWGAFPFFPSGSIIASDLSNGFFVLTPTYKRASYLEGIVSDSDDGTFINMAEITILAADSISDETNAGGSFATGTMAEGAIRVAVFHPDYLKDTIDVILENGVVTDLDIRLIKKEVKLFSGTVTDRAGNEISGAQLKLVGGENEYEIATVTDGSFSSEVFDSPSFEIFVSAWGFKGETFSINDITAAFDATLEQGYQDDFFSDLGWTVESTARSGFWERGNPIGTEFGGSPANPNEDISGDIGNECYVTGNGGGSAGFDDVDNGATRLFSPAIPINVFSSPLIEFSAWFANVGGNTPLNDTLKVFVRAGDKDSLLMNITSEAEGGRWREELSISLGESFFNQLRVDSFQVIFEANDLIPDGHVVEAGIDAFRVLDGTISSIGDLVEDSDETLTIFPNPVSDNLFFRSENDLDIRALKIYDSMGRSVIQNISSTQSIDVSSLQSGPYFLHIEVDEGIIIKRFNKL